MSECNVNRPNSTHITTDAVPDDHRMHKFAYIARAPPGHAFLEKDSGHKNIIYIYWKIKLQY